MDTFLIEALAPVLKATTERSRKLLDAIASQFTIDWATGRAAIQSEEAIVKAFADIKGPDAEQDAKHFLAVLKDGFAVPKASVGIEDPSFFTIPWRGLSDILTLDTLTIENWKWFGIQPWSGTQEIREKLATKFVTAPDYMFEASHLSALRERASSIRYLDPLDRSEITDVTMVPRRTDEGDSGGGGGGGGSSSNDAALLLEFLKAVIEFFKEAGPCLVNGQWSTEWMTFLGRPVYPIGVRICLDKTCADKVEAALWALLAAGGTVARVDALLVALITKGLLTVAQMISWGTWVGAAMIHFALNWAILIAANKTEKGVCIIHLWPFNSALSGGLVNGWAEGRQ